MSMARSAGAKVFNARRAALLREPRRRLPEKPTTFSDVFWSLMMAAPMYGDEFYGGWIRKGRFGIEPLCTLILASEPSLVNRQHDASAPIHRRSSVRWCPISFHLIQSTNGI